MKISVVIPNFNDLRIRRAIASVERQTYRNVELLVIDGGSSHSEVLQYYQTCPATAVLSEKDDGIFDALNKGIRIATGDVIYLMGADDELSDEGVFADAIETLRCDRRLDAVCIGCEFVNAAGTVIRSWYPRQITAARMKRGLLPPHFSLFLRREIYDDIGDFKFRERGAVACDTTWLMDLAMARPDLNVAMLPLHHLRMEYGGASTRSLGTVARQFLAVHRHARANADRLPVWFLYSPVRTLSKIFQFKLPERVRMGSAEDPDNAGRP